MRRSLVCAIALFAVVRFGESQTQAAAMPEFEVASIRLHAGEIRNQGIRLSGERLSVRSVPLQSIVAWAYGIVELYKISGGPGWVASDRWDIEAKGESALTREQARQMLRTLLSDRFAMKSHKETRQMRAYALTVGKNPPRLKENLDPGVRDGYEVTHPNEGELIAYTVTKGKVADLASRLQGDMGAPVLDRTGLLGTYDYKLEWRPRDQSANPLATVLDARSLQEAVREQLGLELKPTTAPIEVLVLDHVEKPVAN